LWILGQTRLHHLSLRRSDHARHILHGVIGLARLELPGLRLPGLRLPRLGLPGLGLIGGLPR
jgi:hypothetical protein